MNLMFARIVAACSLTLMLTACGGAPKKEDVAASIKKIMPANFEILEVLPVKDIPALFEVSVKLNNQPLVLYVDSKAKYVFSGSIVNIETKQNLTQEAQKKLITSSPATVPATLPATTKK